MPSSSVGIPNIAGSGAGCVANSAGTGPRRVTIAMNCAMAAPFPAPLIGLVDRLAGGERLVRIRQQAGRRRLVRHECPYEVRVGRDEREGVDGAAAAGEHVDRAPADRVDHGAHVVGMDLRVDLDVRVGALASLRAAWVIGDDRAIGEVRRERREAGGGHRRPDHHEHRSAPGLALADVVAEHGAGHFELVGNRLAHWTLLQGDWQY